jgi:hypothetical protein
MLFESGQRSVRAWVVVPKRGANLAYNDFGWVTTKTMLKSQHNDAEEFSTDRTAIDDATRAMVTHCACRVAMVVVELMVLVVVVVMVMVVEVVALAEVVVVVVVVIVVLVTVVLVAVLALLAVVVAVVVVVVVVMVTLVVVP